MKIEAKDIRKRLEQDFMGIRFDDGPAGIHDSQRTEYLTYTLGRLKREYQVPIIVEGAFEQEVAFLFYLYLRELINTRRPRFVEWRNDPTVVAHDDGAPERLTAVARFSMRDR